MLSVIKFNKLLAFYKMLNIRSVTLMRYQVLRSQLTRFNTVIVQISLAVEQSSDQVSQSMNFGE